ncbi:hypothetical protein [Kozakia baliensis]|uniref:hypothetical protein n=1 Tax=Kozakia baliensis TaxID=153496 RepID=UPI000497EDBE|nr:hypothetical protein [Kozakia baliensis]
MSQKPKDLNYPLPAGKLVNPDGTATLQFQAFIQRMWERTGSSLGVDAAFASQQSDISSVGMQQASFGAAVAERAASDAGKLSLLSNSATALALAQKALDAATITLMRAQQAEARALKALEMAEELATIAATTRANARCGTTDDESMTFAVMTRKWPS